MHCGVVVELAANIGLEISYFARQPVLTAKFVMDEASDGVRPGGNPRRGTFRKILDCKSKKNDLFS